MIPQEIKDVLKDFVKRWKMLFILLGAAYIAYLSWLFLPQDNIIEQQAEELIKEETGLIVDLTP